MAQDIIGSMFNVDPNQLRQQRFQNLQAQSAQMAQLDPFQRANAAIMQGAGGLTMMGAQALGMKTPEERIAETRQQALSGLNPNDPQSLNEAAQRLNAAGDTRGAQMLIQRAREAEIETSKLAYEKAKTGKEEALTERALREEQGKTIETGVAGKPDYRQKLQQLENGVWEPVGEPYKVGSASDSNGGMKPADELRWMNQHSKDYERASSVIDSSTDANRTVRSIKSNPKLGYLFGGYTEKALSKFAPGEIAGLQSEVSTLKSNLMSTGLNLVKAANQAGIGAITEKEWPIFENMIANLDPKMDEKTARTKLDQIEKFFERAKQRSADLYEKKWKSKQDFYDPSIKERIKQQSETNITPIAQPKTVVRKYNPATGRIE